MMTLMVMVTQFKKILNMLFCLFIIGPTVIIAAGTFGLANSLFRLK